MTPPLVIRTLLRWLLPRHAREIVLGDMAEEFAAMAQGLGTQRARAWYRRMGLRSLVAFWTTRPSAHKAIPAGRLPSLGLDRSLSDIRHAIRGMRRSPGLTVLVTLTLALSIGANSAVFSLANSVMFRAVPGVESPDELVVVHFEKPDGNSTGTSWPTFLDLERQASEFSSLTTAARNSVDLRPENGAPARARALGVAPSYFSVLGVKPLIGRLPTPEELDPASPQPAVAISERLWTTLYGSDPGVIGQSLGVNRVTFDVVGVVDDFRGTLRRGDEDVWYSLGFHTEVRYPGEGISLNDRSLRMLFEVYGRLGDGADVRTAEAQLRATMAAVVEAFPEEAGIHKENRPTAYAGIGIETFARAPTARTMSLLGLVVGIVLLIACANVASLLIARGLSLHGDTAVRRALGASVARIVRENLTYTVVLAIPGALLALLVGSGLLSLLARLPGGPSMLGEVPPLDGTVLAFTFGATMLAALASGLLPAALAPRIDVRSALSGASKQRSPRAARLRSGLTVVQVALSLSLLIGATLLLRTLTTLSNAELGFDPTAVSVFSIDPGHQGYEEEEVDAFFDQLLSDLEAQPGTLAAGMSLVRPFGGGAYVTLLRREDQDDAERITPYSQWVTPGYFDALGQRLEAGRMFTRDELDLPAGQDGSAAIVNATLAHQLFDGGRAVGEVVVQPLLGGHRVHQVIGVVTDARHQSLKEVEAMLYLPFKERHGESAIVVVKTSKPHGVLVADARAAVARLNGSMPIARADRLETLVDQATGDERLFATLLTLMAVLAASLAAVGLYGVVANEVAGRRQEFGIRIALGAEHGQLVRTVLVTGLRLGAVGVLLGWVAAGVLGNLLESRLFGVEALDVPTFLSAAGAFLVLTVAATVVPARAIDAVDPVDALRREGA